MKLSPPPSQNWKWHGIICIISEEGTTIDTVGGNCNRIVLGCRIWVTKPRSAYPQPATCFCMTGVVRTRGKSNTKKWKLYINRILVSCPRFAYPVDSLLLCRHLFVHTLRDCENHIITTPWVFKCYLKGSSYRLYIVIRKCFQCASFCAFVWADDGNVKEWKREFRIKEKRKMQKGYLHMFVYSRNGDNMSRLIQQHILGAGEWKGSGQGRERFERNSRK